MPIKSCREGPILDGRRKRGCPVQTVGSGTWQDIVNTLAAAGTPTTESEDAASGRIAALGIRMNFLRW